MDWLYLMIAGLCECVFGVSLKYTEGFTKLVPTVFTLIVVIVSFWFMSLAMKTLPIGTVYAVWTGIGAVGVALLGMFLFGESKSLYRVFCLSLILIGVMGLKSGHQ